MKCITKKTIILLMGLFFLLGIYLNIPNGRAIERERYISTIAEKDTYVDTANAMSNYGGASNLRAGFGIFGDIRESYFYFNFSDKPSSYIRADISLEFWGVSQTMNFTICLIEESWDEFSMTWLDKPEKGSIIDSLLVTSSGIYKIDITSLIMGRSNISICVYIEIDNYIEDYAYLTSKEGYYNMEDAPQLQWVYTETAEISITNPSSSSDWQKGSTYTITWTSLGSIARVKIELFKADSLIEELTFMYTDNDGSFDFFISSLSDYQEGSDYRIKITDYDDSDVYDFSEYFSISKAAGFSDLNIPSYSIFLLIVTAGITLIILIQRGKKSPKSNLKINYN